MCGILKNQSNEYPSKGNFLRYVAINIQISATSEKLLVLLNASVIFLNNLMKGMLICITKVDELTLFNSNEKFIKIIEDYTNTDRL